MIKKILVSGAAFSLLANVVLADTTNLGINLSRGNLDASGTEQTNSAGSGTGGAVVSTGSGDASFFYGSIFAEREFSFSKFNLGLGVDYVPVKREVDTITGGTGTDAKIELKNYANFYIQPTTKVNNGLSLFARVGYARGDVKISEVSRQATGSGQGTASTDSGANKTLKGPTYGLGVEKSFNNGAFVRASYTKTNYKDLSYTNSNNKKLTADADLSSYNISIGKKF